MKHPKGATHWATHFATSTSLWLNKNSKQICWHGSEQWFGNEYTIKRLRDIGWKVKEINAELENK